MFVGVQCGTLHHVSPSDLRILRWLLDFFGKMSGCPAVVGDIAPF
jgi:hypothetical protein